MKTTGLQKKALEYVSGTLNTFSTFPIYDYIIGIMKNIPIPDDDKTIIYRELNNKLNQIKTPVYEAKEWIDIMIDDMK